METIGLRYFNVFGKRQDPNGAYAAITPSETIRTKLNEYTHSTQNPEPETRDMVTEPVYTEQSRSVEVPILEVFNVAYGGNTTLFQLFDALRENLAKHDPAIANIDIIVGSKRAGDIPHSMASVDKAKSVLGYDPKYNALEGFEVACQWYFSNLK